VTSALLDERVRLAVASTTTGREHRCREAPSRAPRSRARAEQGDRGRVGQIHVGGPQGCDRPVPATQSWGIRTISTLLPRRRTAKVNRRPVMRQTPPLAPRATVWTATLGCVLALIGLALAVMQFRRTTPFSLSASVPYSGWMRWHYVTGAIDGVFTLTWVRTAGQVRRSGRDLTLHRPGDEPAPRARASREPR
jgi:hypothetical protein